MSERLSRERLAVIKERTSQCAAKGRHACRKHGFADATDAACFECELLAHIAALEAENERLRVVVGVARRGCQTCHVDNGHDYCRDCYHAGSGTYDALAALDEEVGE